MNVDFLKYRQTAEYKPYFVRKKTSHKKPVWYDTDTSKLSEAERKRIARLTGGKVEL